MSERKHELPKVGDKIPAKKFFVSKFNVRVDEAFGGESDKALIEHLKWRDIVQPFIARPESKGYGVIVGRRRFLSKMKAGAKTFEVGKDCSIREMDDAKALDASLRENLSLFRSDLNPITRAKAIRSILDLRVVTLRSLARSWRLPASTLSDWLQVLELTTKLQEGVAKGEILFGDARRIHRLKLGVEKQEELADLAEENYGAFRNELTRLRESKGMKRGIPKGKFAICRVMFDKRYPPDVEDYAKLEKLAEKAKQKVDEYAKEIIRTHLKNS